MAAAATLNPAALRLMLDDPRKATEYGRSAYQQYREYLENPISRIPHCSLPDLLPGAASESITLRRPLYREGNVSGDEMMMLCLIAKVLGAQRVFEIRTFDGRTAANLAANCSPSTPIYTLDLPGDAMPQHSIDRREERWIGASLMALPDNVTLLKGDSATFDFAPYRRSIDMFFIDGSHAYDYVRSDTERATGCVRPGGAIVWHDYGQWPGVTRYVNEVAAERDLHWIAGTTLVIQLVP